MCTTILKDRMILGLGSVGKALPGLQTKITAEGEIRVKSEGNMKGYYKEPAIDKRCIR